MPNKFVYLIRNEQSDEGTFGQLIFGPHQLFTAELPWRDNQHNISRIPESAYPVSPYSSSRFGSCWRLFDVPDRTDILIHKGNWAGDEAKGFKTDVEGCILLGTTVGDLAGQKAVGNSVVAMNIFKEWQGDQDFTLTIHDNFEGGE